jgi:hypothetical protein
MGTVSGDDPRQLVRRGYDALSYRYRADDAEDGNYGPWLAALRTRIPAGAAVLDLGCGNGIPVARHLAAAGHAVTGSISARCRSNAPGGWSRPRPSCTPTSPGSPAGSGVRRRGVPVCPYPPAPGRATAAAEPHRRLATTRGLAAGDHRPPGLDRRRGRLARWHRAHVVEPRRRSDLSGVAGGGRPAGHRPGLRPRRRRRSHPVLGPPASTCQPANAVS